MARIIPVICVFASLLLGTGAVQPSPVDGQISKKFKIPGGEVAGLTLKFKGGERACVIVIGDHQPVVPLRLKVEDAQGKLVGEDNNGGDSCAVIWYPPRDGEYRISIGVPHIPGEQDFNIVYIALK